MLWYSKQEYFLLYTLKVIFTGRYFLLLLKYFFSMVLLLLLKYSRSVLCTALAIRGVSGDESRRGVVRKLGRVITPLRGV